MSDKKEEKIQFYASSAEKKRWQIVAESVGLNLSAWLRMLATREAKKENKKNRLELSISRLN